MPKAKESRTAKSAKNEGIVVTSQQSRFHTESIDTPTLKEIDIKDLTISVGGLELLDHAHLRIQNGVHYVFHGRNGTGKSTVLRALAERRVPGVASNLRLLLLGQTRVSSDVETDISGQSTEPSVLEYVTRSDTKRERALRDLSLLSAALEGHPSDAEATSTVVRKLQLEALEHEEKEAQLTAARRSGARGAKARQALIAKEEAVEQARDRLNSPAELDASSEVDDQKAGIDMMENLRSALEAMDAGSTEARARTVLLGLGFKDAQIEAPASQLSGGWRSRCDLACALIQSTDILMLDEPTNFLDLPAIIWLQRYIDKELTGKTVVVVTHDRDFADAVAQELILLRLKPAKTIETFKGSLSEYEAEKRRQIRRMTKMSEAQDRKTKHMEETIASNIKAAKRTGDDKKLKQAASRKKKLDERSGMEVGLKGGRFKLNRDLAGWHNTNRAAIEIPGFDPPVGLSLPEKPADLRHPGSLVSFQNVSFTYAKSGVYTLKDVDLVISPGDRIGLAGLNGSGKSTLIKLLVSSVAGAGATSELRPSKGSITTHPKVRVGYYSQHAVEELESLGKEQVDLTALSHLASVAGPEYSEQDLRGILASLGLKGPVVSDVPLEALSGGQRVRVALAKAVFDSPHLLILDEVTTHLDADTIVSLIEELQQWQGALLVVTHDRYFMRCVVEREKVDIPAAEDEDDSDESEEEDTRPGTVYRMFKAGLQKLDGGMNQYEALVEKALAKRKQ